MEREKQEVLKIIDEIIEKANEIKGLQKRTGMNLIDDDYGILVYEGKELLKYAKIVGECVRETGYISSSEKHHISFVYKGYEFSAFVTEGELQKIREKVLPPTKATEPK